MLTKSKAAFLLSAQQLAEKYEHLYFWTVTFYTLHADWEASHMFTSFLNHLREVVGRDGWGGLRVAELHQEHGVHFHLIVTERLAADLVRRVGRCHGIGRVHVEMVHDKAGAAAYLAKYLSKQYEAPKTKSGRNMRRWAAFGDVPRTKIKDLVNDSPMWIYRRNLDLPFLNFPEEIILQRCWLLDDTGATMKAAWFNMRAAGRVTQDAVSMALGKLEVRGTDYWVHRDSFSYGPF